MRNVEHLTQVEFLEWASENKIGLIDALCAQMLVIGEECALKTAEFYQAKAKGHVPPKLFYDRYSLEVRYDVLKHVVSAQQSTLKAETKL